MPKPLVHRGPRPAVSTEAGVLQRIRYHAKKLDANYRRVRWYGIIGAPDCLVMMPKHGYSIFIEAKRPGANLDEHQEREIDRMRSAGLAVVTLHSVAETDVFFERLYRGGDTTNAK